MLLSRFYSYKVFNDKYYYCLKLKGLRIQNSCIIIRGTMEKWPDKDMFLSWFLFFNDY